MNMENKNKASKPQSQKSFKRNILMSLLYLNIAIIQGGRCSRNCEGESEGGNFSEVLKILKNVEQGWLLGERLEVATGGIFYSSFKGIPYAAPPVGDLRFKAPQPLIPWKGVRRAIEHGPMCPQVDIFTNEYIPGSEDCLYLNIYSPEIKQKKPLPVMFYIHGGGYRSGSGNTNMYGPDFIMKHEVVLVTINYRLDALGFLCLDTKDIPGNAGLKDQLAALKWVQKNIKNFGGDPNSVTIFGQSAGSASTAYHVLSPMSKGLFHKAIFMSGVPISDWSLAYEARRRAFNLGKILGFSTNNTEKLVKFLQKVPSEKLLNTKPYVLAMEPVIENLANMYQFVPVIENDCGLEHFLTESPEKILKKGKINDIDIMLGYTSQESLIVIDMIEADTPRYDLYPEMFVPRQILLKVSPPKALAIGDKIRKYYFGNKPVSKKTFEELATYLSHRSFVYDIHRFLKQLPMKSTKRYLYKFSCISERNIFSAPAGAKYNTFGAAHLEDALYLFHPEALNITVDKEKESYKMIQQTCALFTNFAKFGNPTPDRSLGVIWPGYEPMNKYYLEIGDTLVAGKSVDANVITFWDSIYDEVEK